MASQSLTVPSQLDVAIRRLDVAVQDALLVGVLERLGNLDPDSRHTPPVRSACSSCPTLRPHPGHR